MSIYSVQCRKTNLTNDDNNILIKIHVCTLATEESYSDWTTKKTKLMEFFYGLNELNFCVFAYNVLFDSLACSCYLLNIIIAVVVIVIIFFLLFRSSWFYCTRFGLIEIAFFLVLFACWFCFYFNCLNFLIGRSFYESFLFHAVSKQNTTYR